MSDSAAQSDAKREIHALLDAWHAAATASDWATYRAGMTPNAHWLGSDITEDWSLEALEAMAKERFAKGQGWRLEPLQRKAYVGEGGNYGWFDEVLDSSMGAFRGSGVVERSKETGEWKVCNFVLSFTIPNGNGKEDLEREVFPLKRKYEIDLLAEMRERVEKS